MLENLVVSAWIGIRATCDMTYCVNTADDVDFMLSDGQRRFELAIETEALRRLLDVGSRALAELDTRRAVEAADQQAAGQHDRTGVTA